MTELALSIALETFADAAAIKALHERAFGPGRFARTASRMRETAETDARLCFTARVGTLLVGSIRLTPILIGELRGLILGPLAVEPAFEARGIGRSLIERSIGEAISAGYALIILVGDEPYYARLGFARVPQGRIMLPGPVDPARLLYLELGEDTLSSIPPDAKVRTGSFSIALP